MARGKTPGREPSLAPLTHNSGIEDPCAFFLLRCISRLQCEVLQEGFRHTQASLKPSGLSYTAWVSETALLFSAKLHHLSCLAESR